MLWDIATPRYDYASVAAAEQAYAKATSNRERLEGVFFRTVLPSLVLLMSMNSLRRDMASPDGRQSLELFGPISGAAGLVWIFLGPATVGRAWHAWTMVRAAAGSDAAAWYDTTVANVRREGRLLLAAAAVSAAVSVVAGPAAVVLLLRVTDGGLRWDAAVVMVLPAVGAWMVITSAGWRCVRRPQDVLRAPVARPQARPPLVFVAGVAALVFGLAVALTGDSVPGFRRYVEFDNGVQYPAVEFPVVIARIWVLPFLGGLTAAVGWILIARRHTPPRHRAVTLLTGAMVTVWAAALANPATHDAPAYLWYGAVPAVLLCLALREARTARGERMAVM